MNATQLFTVANILMLETSSDSNNVSNSTDSQEKSKIISTINIINIVILAIVLVIEMILNGFLILVYFLKLKKRTFSNSLYISNCCVDFLNGCIVLPMNIAAKYCYKDTGKFMCYVWLVCDW